MLPDLQEPALADKRISYCYATDRNAYIPTHNRRYAQPPGPDPVWNDANCRNRRIYDDQYGLAAARNLKPYLVQTYRRSLGAVAQIVNDASAPIYVGGRHWGALCVGYVV